ncbi:hypothetical protein JCM16303_000307 [Sporobolomyces ruberrimus]
MTPSTSVTGGIDQEGFSAQLIPFHVDVATPPNLSASGSPPFQTSRSSSTQPIRTAPGKRGPVPTSCEACRRQRAKCIRSKGGQVGAEACTRCVKKGSFATLGGGSISIVPVCFAGLTNSCPGRHLFHPHPSYVDNVLSSAGKPRAVAPRVEQSVVTTQISIARATRLFDLYFDTATAGLELSFIPLLLHDTLELRSRFDAFGGQLDMLEENEQLRCRLIWASAATRWSDPDEMEKNSASPSSYEILKTCRELADRSKIWRSPTRPNLITLLLLFFATASGDLTRNEAQYYMGAACQHFGPLFPSSSSDVLSSPLTGGPEWCAYSVALHDALTSLESRRPCFLSDRDFSVLSPDGPPTYLAPPSLLASYLAEGSSRVVEHCTYTTTYTLYTARLLAKHQARLSRNVTVQQDFDVLEAVWNRSDTLERWLEDALALVRAPGAIRSDGIDLAVLQTVLGTSWMPSLQIEFSALSYIRDRVDEFANARIRFGHSSGPHWNAAKSLHSVAIARSERALCIFLRHTRNREGIYLLAAASGYVCSVERLNDFAAALYHAEPDNFDLFPFGASDKLASLTFFLKSLQNAERIYDSTLLADSIVSLGALRVRLEYETGHSGESALTLFTSHSSVAPLTVPDTPPPILVQAAVTIHRGAVAQ